MGLSLVRAIVTRHGGSVQLLSQEGVGTSVRMVLPVLADAAPVTVPQISDHMDRVAAGSRAVQPTQQADSRQGPGFLPPRQPNGAEGRRTPDRATVSHPPEASPALRTTAGRARTATVSRALGRANRPPTVSRGRSITANLPPEASRAAVRSSPSSRLDRTHRNRRARTFSTRADAI